MPRRLGQHFLIRGAILERIASALCTEPDSLVIEIGPGKGALTERLLQKANRVVAIELDSTLVAHLESKFGAHPGLTIVHADVLDVDLAQWGPAAIGGNLPYYISSPILERFAQAAGSVIRGVFLVQKEVGERITAAPGSRDYGYLSVQQQILSKAEFLFGVPPGAFHPPPKVDSAVVRLTPHSVAAHLGIANVPKFLRFVSLCFRHKRKTLRNNLASAFPADAVSALPQAGLRAEQLSLEQFAALYRTLAPSPH